MGLFGKLFKKDPAELLSKAEALLDRGQGVRALQMAQDVVKGGFLPEQKRAEELVTRCHKAISEAALEEAARSKDAGLWEEAANWVDTALLHCQDDDEEAQLVALRKGYITQSRMDVEPAPETFVDEEPVFFTDFEILVDLFKDDVAERYRGRSSEFEEACQQLAAGQADQAIEVFQRELDGAPQDPILRFERGRAHLILGEFEAAKEDFSQAWKALGDEPLDRAGDISVPRFWGEATLALEQWEEVIEGLGDLALPEKEDASLCLLQAEALSRSERQEEALDYLAEASAAFPRVPQFTFLHALKRQQAGDVAGAIRSLETNVELGCSSGSCSGPTAIFAPSLSLLIHLYLEHDGPRDRLRGLLELLPYSRNGALQAEDVQLLQRFAEGEEDPQSLAWAQEALEQWVLPAAKRPSPQKVFDAQVNRPI